MMDDTSVCFGQTSAELGCSMGDAGRTSAALPSLYANEAPLIAPERNVRYAIISDSIRRELRLMHGFRFRRSTVR